MTRLNLPEIEIEISLDYKGDFELSGLLVIGSIEHKTIIIFKNIGDFESYVSVIDINYDSEDVIFTGCLYKLNIPQFKKVNRS